MSDTTAEARAYAAARAADYAALQQETTACSADAYAERWTSSDDDYLLNGAGTIWHRAVVLGRTYYAARKRLARIRSRS